MWYAAEATPHQTALHKKQLACTLDKLRSLSNWTPGEPYTRDGDILLG
jgi:hypothetical protein